jgi:hypothetical protein
VTLLHQFLYVVAPALLVACLTVGTLGWRALGAALALAALAPFVLLRAVPALPWDLWRLPAEPASWQLWTIVGAAAAGQLRDARLLPNGFADVLAFVSLAASPWWLLGATGVELGGDPDLLRLLVAWSLLAIVWLVGWQARRQTAPLVAFATSIVALVADLVLVVAATGSPSASPALTTAIVLLTALLASTWRPPCAFGTAAAWGVVAAHTGAILGFARAPAADLAGIAFALAAPVPLWFGSRRDSAREDSLVHPTGFAGGALLWAALFGGALLRLRAQH